RFRVAAATNTHTSPAANLSGISALVRQKHSTFYKIGIVGVSHPGQSANSRKKSGMLNVMASSRLDGNWTSLQSPTAMANTAIDNVIIISLARTSRNRSKMTSIELQRHSSHLH